MKKEIKTDFYDNFTCIADKCSFTCCQEWKIVVDDDTYKNWNRLSLTKQNNSCLDQYVKQKDDTRVIALNEQKQCPFLNEQKLCNLVLNFGDEVLSETCAIFPRQLHEFADRKEYSLVSCCPEVVDLINQQDKICFTNMFDIEEDILLQLRTMMITIMQNQQFSISKSLMIIFYILLDIHQNEAALIKEIDKYKDKTVLKELSDTIDNMQFLSLDTFEENNELFLDIAENYRKQGLYTSYLEPIAMIAENLSRDYDKRKMTVQLQKFQKLFSSYEKLFRNYLVVEIFSNCLMPESDLESIVVMIQWITMEYSIMRHSIFLSWLLDEQEKLSYTMVRNYIVVISRMMGYDQEDICEYLDKSFENLIWEWGYFALLIGAE
ncbi:flagellin lysine-N-methylase [Anaerocolumna sp. AGMB13020]|uniref:flagellin lysine-N-methylase n=1 Tax=Anaerocolumna sp. AGMB13020 TaxID=3081750 RepID=UPI002952F80E|nr:flagellin lysine-N-methylase [Anaerocolumna sp. AGMB13020]WOO35856.1 flagellin lysine-N-methylase [Anaerocolumna sp. AGMB13020]